MRQRHERVHGAVERLGSALARHEDNTSLRRALDAGELRVDTFYRHLLVLLCRLVVAHLGAQRGLLPAHLARRTLLPAAAGERQRGPLATDSLGGLFSPHLIPWLGASRLDDAEASAFLAALDLDTWQPPPSAESGTLVPLGALHEAMLALVPSYEPASRTLTLAAAPGHHRKASGSYYTPPELIAALLDQTLEPHLEQACAERSRSAAVSALLALRVCDPSCGVGHVLVAAGHRIARRVARLRSRTDEPTTQVLRRAQHEVMTTCLVGVDLDELAVELCKAALWLESGAPPGAANTSEASTTERPLDALGSQIRCGNALLSVGTGQVTGGIPDAAFPLPRGASALCHERRQQNRQERRRAKHATSTAAASPATRLQRDAWCAAFVWPRDEEASPPTSAAVRRLRDDPGALSPASTARVEALARRYRFFTWELAFPRIFARGGFDVVLGNPPFVNAIEGGVPAELKGLLRALHPELGGTSDLAHLLLSVALRIAAPTGRVGMIQPRTVLNSVAAEPLRRATPGGFALESLWLPPRADLFPGAAVFVAVLAFAPGPLPGFRACLSDDLRAPEAWRRGEALSDNWWRDVQYLFSAVSAPAREDTPTLGQRFEVRASLTTADAYNLVPGLVDREQGDGPRLITTGLIDPERCLWGESPCRFLGQVYRFPRIDPGAVLSPSLARRVAGSRRPKLLVAGLSRVVECFVDEHGECLGAVATHSIFHPRDDLDALRALCAFLLSPDVSRRFAFTLGANALGGGNTTMKKEFLLQLPLPDALARAAAPPGSPSR